MPAADVLANTWPLVLIAAVTLTGSALFFRSRLE
jgi:ABC-2 type transport system permease protein